MKICLKLLAIIMAVPAALNAQVEPAATGSSRINLHGSLNYSLRESQVTDFYGNSTGTEEQTIASGDLGYSSDNERNPFAVTFSGGYTWVLSGVNYGSGPFENLAVSQGFVGRNVSLQLSDSVSYRRQAPITGFSGVPGTGEPIGQPNPMPATAESILTVNTRTVTNNASANISRKLGSSFSLTAGGSGSILRYPDGNGYDMNQISANAGIAKRINARNTISTEYVFGTYTYSESGFSFDANTLFAGYTRQWTRRIQSTISAGPQWITSGGGAASSASTEWSANGNVTDQLRFGTASLSGSHGFDGGGGYLYGGETDQASAAFGRSFGKRLTVELTGGYWRTKPLTSGGAIESKYGASQVSINLGRHFSLYASYTGTVQGSSTPVPSNVLSNLWQVVSFGVSYNSAPIRLRRAL